MHGRILPLTIICVLYVCLMYRGLGSKSVGKRTTFMTCALIVEFVMNRPCIMFCGDSVVYNLTNRTSRKKFLEKIMVSRNVSAKSNETR